jgi:hypothetical protein
VEIGREMSGLAAVDDLQNIGKVGMYGRVVVIPTCRNVQLYTRGEKEERRKRVVRKRVLKCAN